MQPATRQTRYNVSLPSLLDRDLEQVSSEFGISKAEVFRRALTLYKYAVNADKVELTKDNEKQTVLVK